MKTLLNYHLVKMLDYKTEWYTVTAAYHASPAAQYASSDAQFAAYHTSYAAQYASSAAYYIRKNQFIPKLLGIIEKFFVIITS